MFFAPPAKVPRTQRQTLVTSTPPPSYRRTTELDSGFTEAHPTELESAVVIDAVNAAPMPAAHFLSGAGAHMCWLVDENQKLLRLWDVSRPGWERAAPRLAEIPSFAAATEGLPLLVSEMSPAEESLAFCSERGAVSSLDHSIELQMLDGDAAVSAASFVCARRRVGAETVIVTVLGTTGGLLVVDLKHDGTHTTTEFDRCDTASLRWAPNSHNNLYARRPSAAAEGDTADDGSAAELSASALLAAQNDPDTSATSGSWWRSLRSLVSGGGGGDAAARSRPSSPGATGAAGRRGGRDGGCDAESGAVAAGDDSNVWPLSPLGRARRGDSALAFTHVNLRHHYPEHVIAANAAGELFLLDIGPVPPAGGGADGKGGPRQPVRIKWATSLPAALDRAGHVLAVAETRHKVCLLYLVAGTATHPLPALWLVTVDASLGRVVNFVVLNAVADLVSTARRIPAHHIKLFADDTRREVLVSIGAYVVRVNNQVGVRQPCSSEDTLHVRHLDGPLASLLLSDGSLVTLDRRGPHVSVTDVYAAGMPHPSAAGKAAPLRSHDSDGSGAAEVRRLLEAVRADPQLTLDAAVLYASEALYSTDATSAAPLGGAATTNGNWARRNLNVEDENIVLRVTRQLAARQQAHRRLVMAVLREERVLAQLAPETVAQLLSAQEALVCLCALRSLQNVGLQEAVSAGDLALVEQALPPFGAMLDAVQRGGSSRAFLQRRSTRSGDGEAAQQPLMKNGQQLERCQQLLRRAVVSVADALRAEGAAGGLTAAELVFAHPTNVVRLLKAIGNYMVDVRNTVSLSLEEKYAECYAVGCIYVVVAQTIVESRNDVRTVYAVPEKVLARQWTSSTDPASGVELCFSQSCRQLSDTLADVCMGVPNAATSASDGTTAALVALTEQHKCDLLDVLTFLLCFSLTNSVHHDTAFVSAAITATILREPFASGPVGYPHGSPSASSCSGEVGRRVLRLSEHLALAFDAMPILMAFALATPVDDPASTPASYARLQSYCQHNTAVLEAAMQTLLRQHREWELLQLPAVLPDISDAKARRHAFLERHAPHLLWLEEPDCFEALVAEGQTCPPPIAYGPDQLSHRSRCNAVARLAWVAAGAPAKSAVNDLELSEAIAQAQQQFLAAECSGANLGPQAAVQQLLGLRDKVEAWVQAAVIASHTRQPTNEDLLVQVLRHCRAHDGEALQAIYTNSVSERETDARLRQTAVGKVVLECAKLQDTASLGRVCEPVLSKDEFALLSSWVAYLWSAGYETA